MFLTFSGGANLCRSVRFSSRTVRVFRPLSLDAYGPHTGLFFRWFSNEIARGAIRVMMIRLKQPVSLTSRTKASVHISRNFGVRYHIILDLPFMYLPFGARSIVASDWDLFFCIRSNTYDLCHLYRLCCTSNNLPGNFEPMFFRNF